MKKFYVKVILATLTLSFKNDAFRFCFDASALNGILRPQYHQTPKIKSILFPELAGALFWSIANRGFLKISLDNFSLQFLGFEIGGTIHVYQVGVSFAL